MCALCLSHTAHVDTVMIVGVLVSANPQIPEPKIVVIDKVVWCGRRSKGGNKKKARHVAMSVFFVAMLWDFDRKAAVAVAAGEGSSPPQQQERQDQFGILVNFSLEFSVAVRCVFQPEK